MLRIVQFACSLPKGEADALNSESGRIYSDMLVSHYRLYRKQGIWLTPNTGGHWEDLHGGPTMLQAHSRAAAQQGFYKACKTARACLEVGLDVKYPYKRKRWRTTLWKKSGIQLQNDGVLSLSRAKGWKPISVLLPDHLRELPQTAFHEARLVWQHASRHYEWHLVVEDGTQPEPAPGPAVAAVDLGEIHPAALTDGKETCIISCRALRANAQYTQKRVSELRGGADRLKKGSRQWKKVQRRKNRFQAKQRRRARDLEHKVTHAVVKRDKERGVGTLVVGDVRDVADGKHLNTKSQQKIGVWSHGRQRAYLEYKAAAAGMTLTLESETYTLQTCPACMQYYKPKGRIYRCPACGFTAHRDGVGCANLLSAHYTGEPGHVLPPPEKYRHPFKTGKRSRLDTAEMAWVPTGGEGRAQEAAGL